MMRQWFLIAVGLAACGAPAWAQDGPKPDVRERQLRLDDLTSLYTREYMARNHRMGVSVAVADDTLRSQLGLPEGRGLVVTSVAPDGPGDRAGIKVNDILLSVGGNDVGEVDDLRDWDKGGGATSVKLIRTG